jgi:hypothetical protein
MSTTPFVPGCRPWPQEVPELPRPEPLPPAAVLLAAGLLAGAAVAAPVPAAPAATVPLLVEEPHPAIVSAIAARSTTSETAALVLDI